MDINEIRKYLDQYATTSSSKFGGISLADQYRNADNLLDTLDGIEGLEKGSNEYNNFANAFKAQKANAVGAGVLTGITGITDIASNAIRSAQIADTSAYENQISDLRNFGNYNYGTYDQLANDIANNQPNLNPMSFDDIRGMSTGQQIGAVGSSALTGATAGMQIGGPWGAAIGGAVGVVGGLAGVITGNKNARAKEQYLQASADQASATSQLNLQAAHNRIADSENRFKAARVVARGGQIRRKRESLQDFASRVLRAPRQHDSRNYNDIVRTQVDGGVKIRIKVK